MFLFLAPNISCLLFLSVITFFHYHTSCGKGLVKTYRVWWSGAERGWVISFCALGKGWVVQFLASHGGWVILCYNRNRYRFIYQAAGEISLEKESSIQAFSGKNAVYHDLVEREKERKKERKKERREKAERESNLTYEDVEWEKLLWEDLLR